MANHFVTAVGLGPPTTCADDFPGLATHEIITAPVADTAKLRNVLVHLYDQVKRQPVQKILDENLDNIKAFTKQIYASMESGT